MSESTKLQRNLNIKCLFTKADWLHWELNERRSKYFNSYKFPKAYMSAGFPKLKCKYCNFISQPSYQGYESEHKASIFEHLFKIHEKDLVQNDQDLTYSYHKWLKRYSPKAYIERYGKT